MGLLEVYYTSLVIGGVDAEGLTVTFKFTASMIDDINTSLQNYKISAFRPCPRHNYILTFGF